MIIPLHICVDAPRPQTLYL